MKTSVVINCISGAFIAWSVGVLCLGIYTLYWPTAEADVEYYKSERIFIDAPLTNERPGRGYFKSGSTKKIPTDIQITLYSYKVDGVSYSNSTVCYCSPIGISNRPPPPKQTRISYYPSNPKFSVLIKGPDMLLVTILALCGVIMFFGWQMVVNYFVKNA